MMSPPKPLQWFFLGLLTVGVLFSPGIFLVADDARTLIAEWTQRADGTLAPGLAVVITEDGNIERVVPVDTADLPEPQHHFGSGTVLIPGLHELLSSVGAPGEHSEEAIAFDPQANAAAAIDPLRPDLDRSRRAGVLYATVAPTPNRPLSGRAVTFATGARSQLQPVIEREGPLVFAVGESALDANREPTSRSGLESALRRWLKMEGTALLQANLRDGVAAPMIHCSEAMDVRTAAEMFMPILDRQRPTLVLASGGSDAARLLVEVGGGPEGVIVVGPFTTITSAAELRGASALARAGFELALRGDMPIAGPDSLRGSARRAVAHGLDPAAARRAMTINAARCVGLEEQIGAIGAGYRADLVIFDGDPLLSRSEVMRVFQNGQEVVIRSPHSSDVIPDEEAQR